MARRLVGLCLVAASASVVTAAALTDGAFSHSSSSSRAAARTIAVDVNHDRYNYSVGELLAMTDDQLPHIDPLVLNFAVARQIPGLDKLDVAKYATQVDELAHRIDVANRVAEPQARDDPLYKLDRDLWWAGGMCVALAGPSFGITYTESRLDPAHPEQAFLYGLLDSKVGTCASMPVLYIAIGHRLGWPIKGVVSKDHMWARWDDGKPKELGGKRFNLEATSSTSDGVMGSFLSTPDEEYAKELGTSPLAISSGSDFTSLTPRQLLGVFLQSRAGYWAAKNDWQKAEQDLLAARTCFPQNRELYTFLVEAMSRTGAKVFDAGERRQLAALVTEPDGASNIHVFSPIHNPRQTLPRLSLAEVERINRENQRGMQDPTDQQSAPPR